MWTDGRYYLAAEKELTEGWQMQKWEKGKLYFDWIKSNCSKGSRIGCDENQFPAESFKMRSEFFEKEGIILIPVSGNFVDKVWADEKPCMPSEKVWFLDDKYTGQKSESKFKDICDKLPEGCNSLLVTALDNVAWTLNLRGNDIEYNPVFFSYLVIHKSEPIRADLFINKAKVEDVK